MKFAMKYPVIIREAEKSASGSSRFLQKNSRLIVLFEFKYDKKAYTKDAS